MVVSAANLPAIAQFVTRNSQSQSQRVANCVTVDLYRCVSCTNRSLLAVDSKLKRSFVTGCVNASFAACKQRREARWYTSSGEYNEYPELDDLDAAYAVEAGGSCLLLV